MTDSMVERVARAICGAVSLATQTTGLDAKGHLMDWQAFQDTSWPLYAGHAVKAIEAMVVAGGEAEIMLSDDRDSWQREIGHEIAGDGWRRMIDAALSEPVPK